MYLYSVEMSHFGSVQCWWLCGAVYGIYSFEVSKIQRIWSGSEYNVKSLLLVGICMLNGRTDTFMLLHIYGRHNLRVG